MSIPPTKIPISITGLVYRNRAEPGSHCAFSSERIDLPIGLNECLLHNIFSVGMVAENTVGGEMQCISARSETLVQASCRFVWRHFHRSQVIPPMWISA